MTFDATRYDVDQQFHARTEASIRDGALLFRLATPLHTDATEILNGLGANHSEGRFHFRQQLTTYCASNILVCIAEVLFHMYRNFIEGIRDNLPNDHLLALRESARVLVIFDVASIPNLVYADSAGCQADYDGRLGGSNVVFPDTTYEPMLAFSRKVRNHLKAGVAFPSARHSRDLAFALFGNRSADVKGAIYQRIPLHVRLIAEDQDFATPPVHVLPFREKLHATMGYYEFVDGVQLVAADSADLLNPKGLLPRGYVDFVRRVYQHYPVDASIWRGGP